MHEKTETAMLPHTQPGHNCKKGGKQNTMTNHKHTKKALWMSMLSIVLCLSMLVGSTFAWFTDTASTGVNTIVAGNLDIELSYKNAAPNAEFKEVSTDTKDLFVDAQGDPILWEPGVASVCYFKLENVGSLDVVYKMNVSYKDTVTYTPEGGQEVKLSNALRSAIVEMQDETPFADRAALIAQINANNAAALGYADTTAKEIDDSETKYFAMIVYMPTDVDNTYNIPTGKRALEIQLGVDLVATQKSSEEDSFDKTYDENALYPDAPERNYVKEVIPYQQKEAIKIENYEKGYWINIPAGAIQADPSNPELESVAVALEYDNNGTYTFSVTDEKGNELTLIAPARIEIDLGIGYTNVKVNGAAANYSTTGKLTINTQTTGNFAVTYDIPGVVAVSTPDEFITAMNGIAAENAQGTSPTISLKSNIDLTGKNFQGVDNVTFTLDGNGHTISNITNTVAHSQNKAAGGIVNFIGAGNSVTIKNVTLDTLIIGAETGVAVAGGVIGYVDAARAVTLTNVTVKNATILATDDGNDVLHYAGGLIGYGVGYANTNDGAVYTLINITNCEVTADTGKVTTIKNDKGTTGGAIGHASASTFTTTTIDNFKASNTVMSAETGRTDKCGIIAGTAHIGKTVITNCEATDFSNNTVFGTENSNVIVGRLVTDGAGTLTINGTQYTADQKVITIQ